MAVESEKEVKRTTNPGVRIVGGRIYDSSNGKTCHQCRQKTMDFAASCKVTKKNKPCQIKYCHKCLVNRYGEKAADVALLAEWTCPKCRGICNCSFCMKKRGHQPTGILIHRAKATGFSSVSELLQVKGPENFQYQRPVKLEALVTSQKKPGKENSLEGKSDLLNEEPHASVFKKTIREGLKELNNGNSDDNAAEGSSPQKIKISTDVSEAVPEMDVFEKVSDEGTDKEVDGRIKKTKYEEYRFEAQLPEGVSLTAISGIDLPQEDIGNVLQFLEFCSAFGKALDLKNGQAESVMRELLSGRGTKRQQYSMLFQMIIQLLCVILEDRGDTSWSFSPTDDSWFKTVGECVSKSEGLLDDFPPELFEKGIAEYENLDPSKKLKLLNFLCDEALCTRAMRNWIDNQNLESDERKKETKQKVAAAKEKEKQLKQKLQDEVAKAVIARAGAPSSITEHDVIISQIKAEVNEAHAEMVEAMDLLPKKRKRSDAVRTDPVVLDDNGRVFWRLTSYTEEPKILLQDLGTWGEVYHHEKWFTFKSDQQPEIEKYLSCLRVKQRLRRNILTKHPLPAERPTETKADP